MSHRQEIQKKKNSLYTSMVWSVIPMKYSILKVTLQFFLYLFNRKMKKKYINGKIRSFNEYDDTD